MLQVLVAISQKFCFEKRDMGLCKSCSYKKKKKKKKEKKRDEKNGQVSEIFKTMGT